MKTCATVRPPCLASLDIHLQGLALVFPCFHFRSDCQILVFDFKLIMTAHPVYLDKSTIILFVFCSITQGLLFHTSPDA